VEAKAFFFCAMIHDPKIVFLDEPTGGVDPITRREFWTMIFEAASRGTTVFVTTHYMDEAEYCNRVSIMVDGKIAALGSSGRIES
jgi:ABC-2 type transport system ATP-binding protein